MFNLFKTTEEKRQKIVDFINNNAFLYDTDKKVLLQKLDKINWEDKESSSHLASLVAEIYAITQNNENESLVENARG